MSRLRQYGNTKDPWLCGHRWDQALNNKHGKRAAIPQPLHLSGRLLSKQAACD